MPIHLSADEARNASPDHILRVYVGTPLGAPTKEGVFQNVRRACYCARLLVDEGYAPFPPHVLYCMILDEHNPEHRALGINLDMAWMAGAQRVVLFTPDGSPESATSGMRADQARQSELDRRWAELTARIDAEVLAAARSLIQRGLPVEYRRFPEVPEDWSPSFLTPGGTWLRPVSQPEAAPEEMRRGKAVGGAHR